MSLYNDLAIDKQAGDLDDLPQAERASSRILEAAYSQVMLVGLRRTTLTDVAARAGLSRMTVYRRFPDVTSMLQALMFREFGWIVEQASADAADAGDARGQIVGAAVRGVELVSTNELFLRLLDVDPEMLLPYMTRRPGRFQDAAADAFAARLKDAMAGGSVRRDNPRQLARSMLLAMRGFAFSAREKWTPAQRRRTLEDLALMLDGLLRPEKS